MDIIQYRTRGYNTVYYNTEVDLLHEREQTTVRKKGEGERDSAS